MPDLRVRSAAVVLRLVLGLGLISCGEESHTVPRVVHTNDGDIDVYTLELLMALASSGRIELLGVVADTGSGFETAQIGLPTVWKEGREQYAAIVAKARRSGMRHLPDPVAGAHRALDRPASGSIEATMPLDTPGGRLIRDLARSSPPGRPLHVVTGGPLTAVADAWLLDPTIADRLVVHAYIGTPHSLDDYNGRLDAWAAYIVLERLEYIQYPIDLGVPVVTKGRLRGSEIPPTELRQFMIDKQQNNDLPGELDCDAPPVLAIVEPRLVTRERRMTFDGWAEIPTWGNGWPFIPKLREDPAGRARVVHDASRERATRTWWAALSDPAAWAGAAVEREPWGGRAHAVPGAVESEAFDEGGEGRAYHDTEFDGWVAHRTTERVDLESTAGEGSGLAVTRIADGEWLTYSIDVAAAGLYEFRAVVAAERPGGRFSVRLGSEAPLVHMDVPATGGAEVWSTRVVPAVGLPAGPAVLRIDFEVGGFRLDRIEWMGPQ